MPDPSFTCDPATRGQTTNRITYQVEIDTDPGSYVMVDCLFGWDGTSVKPNCDGPITSLRTRNTSQTATVWARLPNKKQGDPWVKLDPATDTTVTQKGTLQNLGLSNGQDVIGVGFQFTDPALGLA